MRLLLALLLTAAPALAQDKAVLDPAAFAQSGAVALYLQARGLATLGQAAKDPLLVAAAARILQGLTLTDTPRQPDPAPASLPTPGAPDAAALLDTARGLDAGLTYSDLIDLLAREVPPAPKAVRATASTLAPGQSEVWTLPFFGGTYGELAILGDGKSNLDMVVTGTGDTQICQDRGSADAAFCGFTLVENGDVRITIQNVGASPDTYLLLTE
jgi:hypothetical protein